MRPETEQHEGVEPRGWPTDAIAAAALRREVPRWRSARTYIAIGALLGFGAPVGFIALKRILQGRRPGRRWLTSALADQGLALVYMGISTPIVFGLFGRALGRREENLHISAEHLKQLRDEFAAVVAHGLRNPLQAILLQVQALLRDARDGEAKVPVSTLERLERGTDRIGQMVDDLQDATSIEAERLSLRPQAVSLPEAVNALIARIRPTLGNHPIEVQVERAPPPVRADPTRLEQILTNLIENAAKYSEEGAPISVHICPAGSGAMISVKDQGPGILPDELPLLFDRFYQSQRAREKKTGLGLGLYITKGLVEAHGGHIEVHTEIGRGSIFSVWLPRV
ncbi:sensor histidine kinase KdpD [Vitiosangium sp. GDMCC 1.1324]|uniref:sensor histidine kinase n=1 Tax=Vitiosangium sp. (strain GDMCC 1.1324) TaxID=2138576 RepID=UPI000D36C005|nr:HAMP domain-containing sensor histidine kinase [Vitiosangium sp. GDMCC 1.1324]PTL77378.1 hypothetical protein DAT35_43975 [Vitiosangium sp. GDMCC 1.1324]